MDTEKLLEWFYRNRRDLSFRRTTDPYHIWVSETMLQQTQVDTVLPFFERFIDRYPDIETLARSSLESILKTVEGIGYYRRFRHLHQAAKVILKEHNGTFPRTYEAILALPGVGAYTAGAIMSIAYNEPYSAVDGNVIRVFARYYGIDEDMRSAKNRRIIDNKNQEIIERTVPRDYTQALMDLGATVCKPKNPLCPSCPLNAFCQAYLNDAVHHYPYLSPLNRKRDISFITLVIKKGDAYCLRKRTEELLHNMYEWPQFEAESIRTVIADLEEKKIEVELERKLGDYRHIFSHQIWHMQAYLVSVRRGFDPNWVLVAADELKEKPMAIAHRKILIDRISGE
ncbi:MAG: A/G-specific adenine glycosylase [Acholeplasmataceae bacterium]